MNGYKDLVLKDCKELEILLNDLSKDFKEIKEKVEKEYHETLKELQEAETLKREFGLSYNQNKKIDEIVTTMQLNFLLSIIEELGKIENHMVQPIRFKIEDVKRVSK